MTTADLPSLSATTDRARKGTPRHRDDTRRVKYGPRVLRVAANRITRPNQTRDRRTLDNATTEDAR